MFHQVALPVPSYDNPGIAAARAVGLAVSDKVASMADTLAVMVGLETLVAVISVVVLPQMVSVVLNKVAVAVDIRAWAAV